VPPPPATAGIISANTAGRQARPYTLPARSRISRLRSQDPAGSLTHTHPSSPGRMGRSHDSIDRGWGHARPPFLPAPHQPQCGTAGRHNYHASTRANVPLRGVPGWTGLSRSRPLITQRCEVVPMATAATLPASPAGPPCMSMPNQYCCLHRRVATTNPSCHSTPRLCLCLFTDRACNACMTAVRRRHPQRVGGRHAILIDEAPSRQTRCVCVSMHACMHEIRCCEYLALFRHTGCLHGMGAQKHRRAYYTATEQRGNTALCVQLGGASDGPSYRAVLSDSVQDVGTGQQLTVAGGKRMRRQRRRYSLWRRPLRVRGPQPTVTHIARRQQHPSQKKNAAKDGRTIPATVGRTARTVRRPLHVVP
jgi:hypothetical protein